MTPRLATPAVVVLVAAGLLVGCGDEETAADRVCEARTEVSTAVSTVVDEARSANLGAARDAVDQVRDALDELRAAADDLADDAREELSGDIEAVRSGVASLTEADGIDDLLARLDAVRNDVEALVAGVGDTVTCD